MRRSLLVALLGIVVAGCGSTAAAAPTPTPSTTAAATHSASASPSHSPETSHSPSTAPLPSATPPARLRPSPTPTPDPTNTAGWRVVSEPAWHWKLLLPAEAVAVTATEAKSASTVAALETANPNEQAWIGAVASQLGDGTDVIFRMSARACGGLVSVNLYPGRYRALGSTIDAVAAWAKAQSATSQTPWTIERVELPAGPAVRVDEGASGTVYYIPSGADLWSLSGTVFDGDVVTVELLIDTIARTFGAI